MSLFDISKIILLSLLSTLKIRICILFPEMDLYQWLLPMPLQWRHYECDGVSIVYSTVCSGEDQTKHQSLSSLAFVRGIYPWPENSPHKRPETRKMFSIWWNTGHAFNEAFVNRLRIIQNITLMAKSRFFIIKDSQYYVQSAWCQWMSLGKQETYDETKNLCYCVMLIISKSGHGLSKYIKTKEYKPVYLLFWPYINRPEFDLLCAAGSHSNLYCMVLIFHSR